MGNEITRIDNSVLGKSLVNKTIKTLIPVTIYAYADDKNDRWHMWPYDRIIPIKPNFIDILIKPGMVVKIKHIDLKPAFLDDGNHYTFYADIISVPSNDLKAPTRVFEGNDIPIEIYESYVFHERLGKDKWQLTNNPVETVYFKTSGSKQLTFDGYFMLGNVYKNEPFTGHKNVEII